MMTGNEVIQTSPVTPARVRVFQPSIRPIARTGDWIETSWGRCKVTGRLGQRHADLLEAILFCAERRKDEDAGTIKLLVDPARVRRVMSKKRYSLEQCWALLKDLRACTIEIDTPRARIMGGVVESAEYTKTETRVDPLNGEQRHLWTVRLGKAWAELMRLDMTTSGDPSGLAWLEHGISKAVARFVLTHNLDRQPNGGWTIDGAIRAVAGALDNQNLRSARRHLRSEAYELRRLGVEVEGDRVRRVTQPPGGVTHPLDSVTQPPGALHTRPGSLGFSGFFRSLKTAPDWSHLQASGSKEKDVARKRGFAPLPSRAIRNQLPPMPSSMLLTGLA